MLNNSISRLGCLFLFILSSFFINGQVVEQSTLQGLGQQGADCASDVMYHNFLKKQGQQSVHDALEEQIQR